MADSTTKVHALVSGRRGFAVLALADGSHVRLDVRRPDEVLPVSGRDFRFLTDECGDLFEREVADVEEARSLLEHEHRGAEALALALHLLDGDLSDDARRECAIALDEALADEGVRRWVERVLWSTPAPKTFDVAGTVGGCSGTGTPRARDLVVRLAQTQPVIREVCVAFEAALRQVHGSDERAAAQDRAARVREGLLHDVVADLCEKSHWSAASSLPEVLFAHLLRRRASQAPT